MKLLKKTIKWLLKSLVLVLAIIILAGLAFKIFGPERNEPLGRLVDIEGLKLHIYKDNADIICKELLTLLNE